MNALLLALLLSQNTPRHPSPATVNTVPVGNGTNWVTTSVPNCNGTNSALTFNNGPGTFGCNAITVDGGVTGVTTISTSSPLSSVSDGGGGYHISITSPLPVANGGTALTTAGDDNVLIGSNSSTYVATNIPDTLNSSSPALAYNASANSFQGFSVGFVWPTLCLGALSTCATSSTPFGGILYAAPANITLATASCNTAGVGVAVGSGNATVKIWNATNGSLTSSCTIPCTNITSQAGASCALSGFLSSTKNFSVFVEGCTTGTNVQCNIIGNSTP